MAFTGTLDKCKACDKTVYVMDLLTLEGMPYHKSCFRCSHCNGTLVISNYSSMEGVLYCKPHFEQLFKESGNFSKNFQTAGKTEKSSDAPQTRAPNRLSSFFSGTQDKCAACQKTVYPLEKMTMEGESYHKTCFRCAHSGCPLTHSSYAALDGVLYCKVHFNQLFLEKGSYNHVLQSANHRRTASSSSTPPPELTADQEDGDKSDAAAAEGGDVAGESSSSAPGTEEQEPKALES
ncbi:PREDICTED: LIM domain-containing protein PLIM2c-like [Tarenaya hassleriana]|uniref:LIM domain-containing protein PLIM2c-like n=1 Tax=Tarenaya hassleriana TaxID=28532 RepID=UPI00053C626E|nr:PREDICTED: LIM domain-containing protein PLIM2c-like [Tarenaya hassleriana]